MDLEQLALLAGILFILIALVGGGFTVREITIPKVPGWARVVALAIGILFVSPFFVTHYPPAPPAPVAGREEPGNVIYMDSQTDRSAHGIQLNQFVVRAEHRPPRVNERIEIAFVLQNVATDPITFQETFVAARNPAEQNRDFGYGHERFVMGPNETLSVKANIVADAPGVWRFWPCYILIGGTEDDYCPSRWRSTPIVIAE